MNYKQKNICILIVSNQLPSQLKKNASSYVLDQADSIIKLGHNVLKINCNPSNKNLFIATISFFKRLKKVLSDNKVDIIHIHCGGLWSFYCSIATSAYPKVVTFHGSELLFDFNIAKSLYNNSKDIYLIVKLSLLKVLSYLTIKLIDFIILINDRQKDFINTNIPYEIIPCGVNMDIFTPINRGVCIKKLKLNSNKKYILFINPSRSIKNVTLAYDVLEEIRKSKTNIEFLFVENIENMIMPLYYNAASLLLITSLSEGSPIMVKEAMACNTPIVSVDVGDIFSTINNNKYCHVGSHDAGWLAKKTIEVIENKNEVKLRSKIKHQSLENIAKKIINVYLRYA